MAVRAGGIVAVVVIALSVLLSAPAWADGPVGADPSANFDITSLPPSCDSDPTGTDCVNAGISWLNQSRASLGQPAYALPRNFLSLNPVQQMFVLTNLDRVLYGLPPITGLNQRLNQDAAGGVQSDSDPNTSDPNWMAYTSNWAGGYANAVIAYQVWMYDDGPGGDNFDCTSSNTSGCWDHRHDILWRFDGNGPLAMGAASGPDSSGDPGYAMLLETDSAGTNLAYTYTWSQAVAAGANGGNGGAPAHRGGSHGSHPPVAHAASAAFRVERVRVRGHRITVTISVPQGTSLKCTVSGRNAWGRRVWRSKRCGANVSFVRVPAGHYWLKIGGGSVTVARRVSVL